MRVEINDNFPEIFLPESKCSQDWSKQRSSQRERDDARLTSIPQFHKSQPGVLTHRHEFTQSPLFAVEIRQHVHVLVVHSDATQTVVGKKGDRNLFELGCLPSFSYNVLQHVLVDEELALFSHRLLDAG